MRSAPRLVVVHGAMPAYDLLRVEAASFHGVPADHVVLVHRCPRCGSDTHGRPHLLATAALRHPAHVSVARAGDLSVVAVTDAGPVGVDVEPEGAADFSGFEGVALHPGERAGARTDATRVWVRKEALLKAQGLGLAVDPRDVRLDEHGLVAWASHHDPPGTTWLRDVAVPGHVAAVAVLPPAGQDLADLSVTVGPASQPRIVVTWARRRSGGIVSGGRPAERGGRAGLADAARPGRARRAARPRARRRATRTSARDGAVAVPPDPGAQQLEEQLVAQREPQRVEQERAALVDPVVEHGRGPGSPSMQVLRPAASRFQCSARASSAVRPPDSSDHSHSQ